MSNPWKKNILDRSLDDLATDNQKYKKSAQYKKDLKQAEVAEKKRAAAERKAKADAEREERIATQTAVAESSVNGSIDLTQFFDEEKAFPIIFLQVGLQVRNCAQGSASRATFSIWLYCRSID